MNFGNINIDDLSSYSVQELQVNMTQNFQPANTQVGIEILSD